MASHEMLTRITGDPIWSDRVEDLAFNSLPASLDQKQRGIHYITSANSIAQLDRTGSQAQFQNGFPMQAYMLGIDNYRCCPHNYGMGWPYYVEEMWAATPDAGLAANLHGPSRVTATVGRRYGGDDRRRHHLPVRRHDHLHGHRPQTAHLPALPAGVRLVCGTLCHRQRGRCFCGSRAGVQEDRTDLDHR